MEHIIGALGEWQGIDAATGFQLVKTPDGRTLRIADLVDDDANNRDLVHKIGVTGGDVAKRIANAKLDLRSEERQSCKAQRVAFAVRLDMINVDGRR